MEFERVVRWVRVDRKYPGEVRYCGIFHGKCRPPGMRKTVKDPSRPQMLGNRILYMANQIDLGRRHQHHDDEGECGFYRFLVPIGIKPWRCCLFRQKKL